MELFKTKMYENKYIELKQKYEKSIIYKLCHKNDITNENIYIGSTLNFRRRKWEHKSRCINTNLKESNKRLYKFICNNGGWNEWLMIPIEAYPCESKSQLLIRERFHIENLQAKLNCNIPSQTLTEYNLKRKDSQKEYNKKYREINKEKIEKNKEDNKEDNKQKYQQYYKKNKEKITEIQKIWKKNNKEKKSAYSKKSHEKNKEKNREKRNEDAKIWRKNNKEKLSEKSKEKTICENCGCEVTKKYLKKHQKTKKCIEAI